MRAARMRHSTKSVPNLSFASSKDRGANILVNLAFSWDRPADTRHPRKDSMREISIQRALPSSDHCVTSARGKITLFIAHCGKAHG